MRTTHRPRRRRPASPDEIVLDLAEWRARQAREIESDLRRLVHQPRGGRSAARYGVDLPDAL